MRNDKLHRQIILFFLMMSFVANLFANSNIEVDLTPAQRSWLNNHPIIRLAIDKAWPPFEWIDNEMQYQGIASDYMSLIEQKLGIRFELEKNKPWSEVVAAVKDRKLDVFSCVAKNPQRLEYVNFTRPYLSFPMVIITTSDVSYIDGVNDLTDKHVSVVKGYATHEYLIEHYPKIKLYLVNTSEEGLEAVSKGKVDVFIDNIATATNIIKSKGLTNLKISGEMPVRYELAMAVRKDWPELINVLQLALDSINYEQRQNIHNKWIGVRYEHGFDYDLFWKSFTVFILIVGFLYFYNRKLSLEINQRKTAEKTAMRARDDADKANRAKTEFLSVMSHELRTPLTSIKGALGLLIGGKVADIPPEAQTMLGIANENSDRLAILIDEILDIEKMLAGKMNFKRDKLVIGELLTKATTANQGYADKYKVGFKIEVKNCAEIEILADESRLMQVFSNLLSNAVKYSPTTGSVLIKAQCVDNKVRISVSDQGNGIPEDFQSDIFNRFSQADSSDTREKGGTGLGLAIAKEIIERLGGEIGFNSQQGKGATFYFEFDICLTE